MRCLHYLTVFISLAAAVPMKKHGSARKGATRDPERTCDMDKGPGADFDEWAKKAATQEAAQTISARETVIINTWFHVVAAGKTLEDGWVEDEQIDDTLLKMNQEYAPHGFSFKNAGITRTVNKKWSYDDDSSVLERGQRLRRGDYQTLNIYIVEDLSNNAAGRCSFPVTGTPSKTVIARDGCRIAWDTLPPSANGGITAVHEVGHWLGLRHSFNAGKDGEEPTCEDGTGDNISDTPTHLVNRSCKAVNTCPNQAGEDPIHNFMNYTGTCRSEFTPGQQKRMHSAWNLRVQVSS